MSVGMYPTTAPVVGVTFAEPSATNHSIAEILEEQFAFARINGDVCLVQFTNVSPFSPTISVNIFRHEFITIFRYSHSTCAAQASVRIFQVLDARGIRYEEDSGTVFLAKDLVERLRWITERRSRKASASRACPVQARHWG
ncbi:hypothetical protein SERLADRAFT_456646 [Serpula lacrymans var. lacrymans S7.9]|uniref:Uncharacterized protein n=1 Tax=Serpula lacrymans var. lacrymans (strain S7.9) TaxID=578457 RepID=F8NHN6_SERL9|nr:uncharacterized protein SERLADRAFT_456646 [Serpula lacrymans var. lacrymans S7.9]EGO29204.1 hypothetical protein SERLADRAFT_456646 [Serpula lacrymans var. lacrymans S7.9]